MLDRFLDFDCELFFGVEVGIFRADLQAAVGDVADAAPVGGRRLEDLVENFTCLRIAFRFDNTGILRFDYLDRRGSGLVSRPSNIRIPYRMR